MVSRASQTWPPHLSLPSSSPFSLLSSHSSRVLVGCSTSAILLSRSPPPCRQYRRPCLNNTSVLIYSTASTVFPFLSALQYGGPSVLIHLTEPAVLPSSSIPLGAITVLVLAAISTLSPPPTSSRECFTLFVDFTAPTIPLNSQAVSPFSSFAKKFRRFSHIYARLSSYVLRGAVVSYIHSYAG